MTISLRRVLAAVTVAGSLVCGLGTATFAAEPPSLPTSGLGTLRPKPPAAPPQTVAAPQIEFETPPCDPGAQSCITVQPGDAALAQRAAELNRATPLSGARVNSGGASIEAIQPVPDECDDYPDGVWTVLSRTQACSLTPWTMTVTTTTNGVPAQTGGMEFMLRYYTYTSATQATWAHQIELITMTVWGDAVGTVVTGAPACNTVAGSVAGSCGSNSFSFPPKTLALAGGQVAAGEAFQTFTGTGPSKGQGSWTLTLKSPKSVTPATARGYSLDVRCDKVLPNYAAGCVFPQYTSYLYFARNTNPEFTRHVEAAQASGLPGAPGRPLHRIQDATLRDLNGRTACPSSSNAPWLPRPTSYECDEYPFRSTAEGAYTGGGTARTHPWCQINLPNPPSTGATGYSICMIWGKQNSSAGGILNSLYNANRVIDGDPFYVVFN